MRMAFLPGLMLLAGGVAWGQALAGTTAAPVQLTAPRSAPVLVPEAQVGSTQTLAAKEQETLALQALEKAKAAALARAPRTERAQASLLEPIPTQWPHARPELIPTQWPKINVELVGGATTPGGRPAEPSQGRTASAAVVPR